MMDYNLYFDYSSNVISLMNKRNKPFYENLLLVQEWKIFSNFYSITSFIDSINYKLIISKWVSYNQLRELNIFMKNNQDWYGAFELVLFFESFGFLYESQNVNGQIKELLGDGNETAVNVKLLQYNVFKAIWDKIDDNQKKRLTDQKKFVTFVEENYKD